MKIYSTIYISVALAAAMALAGCSNEDEPIAASHSAVTFEITDTGFASVSRASESGYRTEFTAGDACGLYIVRNGNVVYENVKLTATAQDDNISWQPETPLGGGLTGESYYLYYPYQEDMTGKINVSATDDDGFFAPLISSWEIKADQSDYADYTASDLMTSKGKATATADGKLNLSFAMSHRMALAVIEMPKTVYKFTDTSIPDYTVDYTPAQFTGAAKPFGMDGVTYRYIVNPSLSAQTIIAIYDEGKKECNIIPSVAHGNYKTYRVNGAQPVEKTYNIQIGDYLLVDGTLVSRDETLTDEQKAKVVAIVFWSPAESDYTNPNPSSPPARLTDDKIMANDYPNCTHGLALSVNKLTFYGNEKMKWQQSQYEHIKNWQSGSNFNHPLKDKFASVASNTGPTDQAQIIYGYQNTVVYRAYNAYCTSNNRSPYYVIPVIALDEFVKSHPAPKGSTGWFLPSSKEMGLLVNRDSDHAEIFDTINTYLSKAGGDVITRNCSYWSSTEHDYNHDRAFRQYMPGGSGVQLKSTSYRARVVCAF